jgi:hypothetical protein
VGGATPVQVPAELWEFCEIKLEEVSQKSKWYYKYGENDYVLRFYGGALGPKGLNWAGESKEWKLRTSGPAEPDEDDKEVRTIEEEFIGTLTASGWEPLPEKGRDWWSYKFRRQVKS